MHFYCTSSNLTLSFECVDILQYIGLYQWYFKATQKGQVIPEKKSQWKTARQAMDEMPIGRDFV